MRWILVVMLAGCVSKDQPADAGIARGVLSNGTYAIAWHLASCPMGCALPDLERTTTLTIEDAEIHFGTIAMTITDRRSQCAGISSSTSVEPFLLCADDRVDAVWGTVRADGQAWWFLGAPL